METNAFLHISAEKLNVETVSESEDEESESEMPQPKKRRQSSSTSIDIILGESVILSIFMYVQH